MDFSTIPITQFYEKCLKGARNGGFKWVVSLIARESDINGLYQNIKKSWYSLDSITNKYFLFVFAGKKNSTFEECWESRVVDECCDYIGIYNEYVSFLNDNKEPLKTYIRYDWQNDKENLLSNISKNQTEAINELKAYFNLREAEIPCLVFTSLFNNRRIIVPIENNSNDLYSYFKNLFNIIEPKLILLDIIINKSVKLKKQEIEVGKSIKNFSVSKEETIVILREELLKIAIETNNAELYKCIYEREYGFFEQPLRGKLSRFIDLVKNYEKSNGSDFDYDKVMQKTQEKFKSKIEFENNLSKIIEDINDLEREYLKCVGEIESIISSSKVTNNFLKTDNKSEARFIVYGGQVQHITATDNSVVTAIQDTTKENKQLSKLISDVRGSFSYIDKKSDTEFVEESLSLIEEETQKAKPRKKILSYILDGIKAIKGSAEFSAAIVALADFCINYFKK